MFHNPFENPLIYPSYSYKNSLFKPSLTPSCPHPIDVIMTSSLVPRLLLDALCAACDGDGVFGRAVLWPSVTALKCGAALFQESSDGGRSGVLSDGDRWKRAVL